MKPIRIQRSRKKGWKMPENTVYVGRPTKWGNPVKVGMNIDFEKAKIMFMTSYISPSMIEAAKKELKGKNLACFCPLDKPCHADVLLEIANS